MIVLFPEDNKIKFSLFIPFSSPFDFVSLLLNPSFPSPTLQSLQGTISGHFNRLHMERNSPKLEVFGTLE
jgi:hypothetical protein